MAAFWLRMWLFTSFVIRLVCAFYMSKVQMAYLHQDQILPAVVFGGITGIYCLWTLEAFADFRKSFQKPA